jgi:uncharacterized membrane protein
MSYRRHARFLGALAAGAAVGLLTRSLGLPLRMLLAGDTFFIVYLVLTGAYVVGATPSHLRERAERADEGLPLIVLVTVAAAGVSVGAIFLLLSSTDDAGHAAGILAVASIPLGWLTLHTVASFHYANLFYAPTEGVGEAGGLDFPGTPEPGPWDFLYFSFVIGMTAQVSDVAVRTTPLRRAALAHGVASFFYNAVILALAVNAAISHAG